MPFEEKPKEGKGEDVKINNLDIAKGVQVLKPGKLIDKLGEKAGKIQELTLQEYDPSGFPGFTKAEISSHSSAADLIIAKLPYNIQLAGLLGEVASKLVAHPHTSQQHTALSLSVFRGHHNVVEAIFTAIRSLDWGLGRRESFGANYTTNELRHLLVEHFSRNSNNLPLLGWALAFEDLKMAEILIKHTGTGYNFLLLEPKKGGAANDGDEDDSEEKYWESSHPLSPSNKGAYTGMASEGVKRSDWGGDVVPYEATFAKFDHLPIHIAAFYGSRASLDFLLGDTATKALRQYFEEIAFKECDVRYRYLQEYAQGDVAVAAKKLFGLDALGLRSEKSVFHYAIKVGLCQFHFF